MSDQFPEICFESHSFPFLQKVASAWNLSISLTLQTSLYAKFHSWSLLIIYNLFGNLWVQTSSTWNRFTFSDCWLTWKFQTPYTYPLKPKLEKTNEWEKCNNNKLTMNRLISKYNITFKKSRNCKACGDAFILHFCFINNNLLKWYKYKIKQH